ncbi:MAG: hypothetical protein FWC78_04355 [Defluviitaleaceae bacterium]|nr:hypothetical protein [Defluviitaleaceae bacterium]
MKQKMIDFLLENANPSIRKRIKSEIFGELTNAKSARYQQQILSEATIQGIIAAQQPDGWIGETYNNGGIFRGHQCALQHLTQKALNKNTPILARALEALDITPPSHSRYGRGFDYDEFKYPGMGAKLSNSAIIAAAGYADIYDITQHIQLSLDSIKRITEVESVFDILHEKRKNGRTMQVFNDYEKWPCTVHFQILAYTQSWRNEATIKAVAQAVNQTMRTDDPHLVSFIPGSQVGCFGGGFPAQGMTVKGSGLYPSPIMCPIGEDGKDHNGLYHFAHLETFARCGIIPQVPELKKLTDEIASSIDTDGICRLENICERLFKTGKYYGMQLETDWRTKTRKACDITFRALLILHYAGY